jgi:lipid II:glycine glycyltransferase (peptidoglycan interpeptide bridge formation enzyme)
VDISKNESEVILLMEPQQTSLYASYMTNLGWQVKTIDTANIFMKKFPFMGGMIKIHRPEKLPSVKKLLPFIHEYAVKKIVLEPVATQNPEKLLAWCQEISQYISLNHSPYLPTKTIRIDLTPKDEQIFSGFSEAKRRAVRRATKLGVTVKESSNIQDLIRIKNKSAGLFGFITTTGVKELWPIFYPNHASILLAYSPSHTIIGGVLLLYCENIAYYWIAGATKEGKKLFAPTLLAWEAMKLAKNTHSSLFDFVGVWDERIPKENTSWHGFTKFKEGFGGKNLYYPLVPFV